MVPRMLVQPTGIADFLAIICICQSEIDDNATIQCDRCGRWQHMRCVGIDPTVVDLDDLVYHCDHCEPRHLDVDAAKAYIEHYQRDEIQIAQSKPRRGRGKGAARRGGGRTASPGLRPDARRTKSQKQVDSDETDDMTDSIMTNGGLRDYTLIDSYLTTEDAASWMRLHSKDYPSCPAVVASQSISTSVRSVPGTNGALHGLYAERDAPANAFVGRYMGVIGTREQYKNDPRNKFDLIRGPLSYVSFVQLCDLVIDARISGSESRYMRKSCSPNCAVVPLILEGQGQATDAEWQFSIALKDSVRAGDELTIGYQWSEPSADRLPGLQDPDSLDLFSQNILSILGNCACSQPQGDCLVAKWRTRTPDPDLRKRSVSRDIAEETALETPVERGNSADVVAEQPMTREERKIQMAIARMENADAPKAKRRRRNTGDENPRLSRRASSMKVDETSTQVEDSRRSISPVVPARVPKTIKASSSTSRARLIRSPSPEFEISDLVPRKMLWLRTFDKEKAIKEEQRVKLAEQAKEATARLAEEAARKKMEIEAQAREARETREREAEALRRKVEREAKEASQRAREREIWGDHPVASAPVRPQPPDLSESKLSAPSSSHSPRPNAPVVIQQGSLLGRVESPTSMGPPTSGKEQTKASPPAAVIPKIVRKLSVSEYMRQRKEKAEAATDVSPSPVADSAKLPDDNAASQADAEKKDVDDEKSDGEIEPEEIEVKREPTVPTMSSMPPSAPRGDFLQMPPTAPKAANFHHPQQQQQQHHPSAGPMIHPSRAYPSPSAHAPNHFQPYPRHGFGPDQRQNRPPHPNGYLPNGGSNDNYHRAPIPTGPKFSRAGSSTEPPNNAPQPMNGMYGKDSGRPAPPHDHH